jgi:hypothetical protein
MADEPVQGRDFGWGVIDPDGRIVDSGDGITMQAASAGPDDGPDTDDEENG